VDDVKKMGHDALSHISQAAEQARNLMKQTLGRIPGVGKFLAAGGDVLANVVSGAANVGDTAIAGGDVAAAAENMGKNAAGAAVGAVVGLVDPTGMVSGLAESGVDGALGAKPQVVQT
ncbi:MAG TPA: HrpF/NolX family T3SS translocon protein, partial [Burkholderiaceae bacterium]